MDKVEFDAVVYDLSLVFERGKSYSNLVGAILADDDCFGDSPTIECTVPSAFAVPAHGKRILPSAFAVPAHGKRIRVTMELLDDDGRK